jgi:hypothetical protein
LGLPLGLLESLEAPFCRPSIGGLHALARKGSTPQASGPRLLLAA